MKGKVTLLPAEQIKEGKLYITKIDGRNTPVVAKEDVGEGFSAVKIANTSTIKVVKSNTLQLPIIKVNAVQASATTLSVAAIEVTAGQYPVAIVCLDGREVEYDIRPNGAYITNYAVQTPSKAGAGIQSANSINTVIDEAVAAERARVMQILKDVQSSTMGGMKLIGADPMHAQVSFDIAMNKVKNGEEASLVPETLEKLYDKLGIKSNRAKAVTLNALLDSFVDSMRKAGKS